MSIVDDLAETHIQAALARGEFDDLPGNGRPLKLDDDSMVPKELRAGYRLLKNSGHLPPELALIGEIKDVEGLISKAGTAEHERLHARLRMLQIRLDLTQGDRGSRLILSPYIERLNSVD